MLSAAKPITLATVGDAFTALLAELRAQVRDGSRSAATLAMHSLHVRILSDVIAPTTPIASIDQPVLNSLVEHVSRGVLRPLSQGSLSKRVCTLRMAFDLAERFGWQPQRLRFPRFRGGYRPRRAHLRAPDELIALCKALPLERAAWVLVATFTGQHPSDVERMRAYVDADPFAEPPWFRRRNTKNRKPEQVMVMPAPLAVALRSRFESVPLTHGQPIVPHWDKDNRSRTMRRLARQLGLGASRATDLRHTCATWAAHELGTLTVGLMEWLGHSDFTMLSRVYAHALPAALGDVAEALARAVAGVRLPPQQVPPSGTVPGGKGKPPTTVNPAKKTSDGGRRSARSKPRCE